jgi:hypothetical protein
MDTVHVDLSILCICGQPQGATVHQGGGHLFKPHRGRDQIRDDQTPLEITRAGHYRINEYRVINLAQPAAGADLVATVPATVVWEVKALQFQLTTSAAVGNRIPHLVLKDSLGFAFFNFPAIQNQQAAQTLQYSAGISSVAVAFDNSVTWVLPYVSRLLQQWTIGTLTTGLLAGDQWANCNLLVEEWLSF